MPDAVVFPALGLLAAGVVALALVWPQGEGAASPPPFGHPVAPLSQPIAAAAAVAAAVQTPIALRGPKPAPGADAVNGAAR
jgi:hypothetical protein